MRLGIDIDGTITTAYYWLEFFNRHFGTRLEPDQVKHYDHHIDLGISLEAFRAFRLKNLVELHRLAEPRDHAIYLMNRLRSDGHETFLITAREKSLQLLTQSWLKEAGIHYSKLYHLGSTEKVALAKQLGVELFLEDRYETALAMAQSGIPVILFETSYNKGPDHPLIVRVEDWPEAYALVDKVVNTHYAKHLSI